MKKTLNFGHRGFKSRYPENTMISFEKALAVGVDGLEFDVHLSKDGVPVIIHDETLERTCNKSGFVKDLTLAELKTVNAGANFKGTDASKSFNEKIPTLEEYFDLVKTKNIISNIELKTGVFEYTGIEEKVYELIKKYSLQDRCIISSFNHESILRFKKIAPQIKCGFLVDSWQIAPASYLKQHKIECYHPSAYLLTRPFVDELHSNNIEVNAWFGTIQFDYAQVIKTGLDGIITDFPDKVESLLGR